MVIATLASACGGGGAAGYGGAGDGGVTADGAIERDAALDAGTVVLASGRILFAAHHTSNPDAPMRLYVVNADGSGLARIQVPSTTDSTDFGTPEIERYAPGAWRVAYGQNGITVFDSVAGTVAHVGGQGATRADFNADASRVVYQQGTGGAAGINLFSANTDGTSIVQLTHVPASNNAEWPYFVPGTERILHFATFGTSLQHTMGLDGAAELQLAMPGGAAASHESMKADGSEFLNAELLTSYSTTTGAIGSLNNLKGTTTLMAQLDALGYLEVPIASIPGQANRGTFALSADWSRDGTNIVFDALLRDKASGNQAGIGVFVYDIVQDTLRLIYGPEPFNGARTNNYNYSIHTPKWVP